MLKAKKKADFTVKTVFKVSMYPGTVGGPGAPETGEGAGRAPLGGGSEDGARALLPVATGVVRGTGGVRLFGIA